VNAALLWLQFRRGAAPVVYRVIRSFDCGSVARCNCAIVLLCFNRDFRFASRAAVLNPTFDTGSGFENFSRRTLRIL